MTSCTAESAEPFESPEEDKVLNHTHPLLDSCFSFPPTCKGFHMRFCFEVFLMRVCENEWWITDFNCGASFHFYRHPNVNVYSFLFSIMFFFYFFVVVVVIKGIFISFLSILFLCWNETWLDDEPQLKIIIFLYYLVNMWIGMGSLKKLTLNIE